MRKALLLSALSIIAVPASSQNVGLDIASPQQKLDVAGAVRIGNTSNNSPGSIRWDGTSFQVRNNSAWVNIDAYDGSPASGITAGMITNWNTAFSWGNHATAGYMSNALLNGRIYVGDGSNVATGVPMSGDATLANTGAITISALAVTTGKLNDAAVTTLKLADANVTNAKLADGAVTSAKIQDGTIVNADIGAGAAIARSKIAIGTANRIVINDGTGALGELAFGGDGTVLQVSGGALTWASGSGTFIQNQASTSQTGNFRVSGRGIFGDGTAASPSIAFEGSQATGFFSPAANSIGFSTNGAERARIKADGNLGLGVADPQERLDMAGNIRVASGATRRIYVQDPAINIAGNSLELKAASADPASSTASAGGSLSLIAGAARASIAGHPGGNIRLRTGGNAGATSPPGDIVFETGHATLGDAGAATERMRILGSSGRVGIGTDAPAAMLDIRPANGASSYQFSTTGNDYPRLYMGGSSTSVAFVINRLTTSATQFFGEDGDTGGFAFRGTGGTRIGSLGGSGTRFVVADGSGNLTATSSTAAGITTGSGTTNYVTKWTAANTIGNSQIFDNGAAVGVGTATPLATTGLDVRAGSGRIVGNGLFMYGSGNAPDGLPYARLTENWGIRFTSPVNQWVFTSGPSILIGHTPTGEDWGSGSLYASQFVNAGTTFVSGATVLTAQGPGTGADNQYHNVVFGSVQTAMNGISIYASGQLDGDIKIFGVPLAHMLSTTSAWFGTNGNSTSAGSTTNTFGTGADNQFHTAQCADGYIATGIEIYASSHLDGNMKLRCTQVASGFALSQTGMGIESLINAPFANADDITHMSTCPVGTFVKGIRIYASSRLDNRLQVFCTGIRKN